MEALVGSFNKEKAQVGAFSVIVKSSLTFVSTSTQGGEGRRGSGEPQPRAARTQLPAQRGHLLRTCRGQGEGCGHCSVSHYSIRVVSNGKLPLTLISMVCQVRGSFPGVAIDQGQVRGSCPDL